MVGADLANLVNEAALLAARRSHKMVEMADFTDAVEKIVLGVERRVMMTQADRERTAYHEAGHALVGMLSPDADPVRKVSIIPRGMALGVTFSAPDSDRFNYDEAYLKARLRVALGGRVAEELVYDSISSGAESDIQQMTAIARQMVGRWGMSPAIGPVAVLPADGEGPLLPGVAQTSEDTQKIVDAEVRRLADEAHADTTRPAAARAREAGRAHEGAARGRDARRGRCLRRRRRAARHGRLDDPAPAPEAVAHAAARGAEPTARKDETT